MSACLGWNNETFERHLEDSREKKGECGPLCWVDDGVDGRWKDCFLNDLSLVQTKTKGIKWALLEKNKI